MIAFQTVRIINGLIAGKSEQLLFSGCRAIALLRRCRLCLCDYSSRNRRIHRKSCSGVNHIACCRIQYPCGRIHTGQINIRSNHFLSIAGSIKHISLYAICIEAPS